MREKYSRKIDDAVSDAVRVLQQTREGEKTSILVAAEQMLRALRGGGKLLICGNGGSAADAQHMAAELVIRLRGDNNRPAIPALALTTDSSILTAGANDYGFENIFARQIEALGRSGDTLIAISTSGNSPNVLEAVNMAHEKGLYVVGLLGGDGGRLKQLVDLPLVVPAADTARIQEVHGFIIHLWCDILESDLFG